MAKKSKAAWPKMLYCMKDNDGDDDFIIHYESPEAVAVAGQKIPVAVYQFVGMFKVVAPVSLEGAVVAEVAMNRKTGKWKKRTADSHGKSGQ